MIRHAPVATPGHLFGRTDVSASLDQDAIGRLKLKIGPVSGLVSSPARRCRETATALFGKHDIDQRLWEQDFGDHDGLPFTALPDIGVLPAPDLAQYAAPNGESFSDLCARCSPALTEYGRLTRERGPMVVLAHAGVVRAAIALVTGDIPGALSFEVDTLSMTRLRCGAGGPVSVIGVNQT